MTPDSPSPDSGHGHAATGTPVPASPDETDLQVDFLKIVNRPLQRHPVRPNLPGDASAASASKGPHGNRVPIERKAGDGTKPFTRLITRPETTVAATTAAESAPAERVNYGTLPEAGASYGKLRTDEEVIYTPNRLHGVIDNVWTHSPLKWMDHLGKVLPVIGFLAIAAVLTGVLWNFSGEVQRQQAAGESGSLVTPERATDADRQAAIRRSFDAFLAAPGVAEKLPWVLDAQRVESRMKDFYIVRQEKDPTVVSYEVSLPIQAAGEWWFTLTCVAPDRSQSTIPIKETPAGGQLDWENFVAYGSMPWDKFHTARPVDPQSIRARIRPSTQYAGKYPKEDFFAFEISHRTGPPVLHGYAPRNSRTGQLLAALPPGADWQPANLYLRWEPDARSPGCVVIADLIRNNWLDAITSSQTIAVSSPP